jgi:hypothetical protein
MKTVIYQIPVSPVEEKQGINYTKIENTLRLDAMVTDAYHIANRAVTLWLHEFYPQPPKELMELKEGYQIVQQAEQKIKQAAGNTEREILKQEKRIQRTKWEDAVAASDFYKKVKTIIAAEFPGFPPKLRSALLHKVVLDWLYAWMNQHPGGNFTAAFPFYKHEVHVPLCYDGKEVYWKQLRQSGDGNTQYILKWLNGIEFKTNFQKDVDRRLPVLLNQLYFTHETENVRNRKAHNLLQPTLKKAGTKWSIHIPVLEEVIPVSAEQQEPLFIAFGFIHPLCYAWGTNHAKPLSMDKGTYIQKQMQSFEKRKQKAESNTKLNSAQTAAALSKIETAKENYIQSLYTKAVQAIILLATKAHKNKIVIEQWPLTKPIHSNLNIKGTPPVHERLLTTIKGWDFETFYCLLQKEAAAYQLEIIKDSPCSNAFELHLKELRYTQKNKITKRKEIKKWVLTIAEQNTQAYHMPLAENGKLGGYFTFSFDREYSNTNTGFTLYSSPRSNIKTTVTKFVYRIHIDMNLVMNFAFAHLKK